MPWIRYWKFIVECITGMSFSQKEVIIIGVLNTITGWPVFHLIAILFITKILLIDYPITSNIFFIRSTINGSYNIFGFYNAFINYNFFIGDATHTLNSIYKFAELTSFYRFHFINIKMLFGSRGKMNNSWV